MTNDPMILSDDAWQETQFVGHVRLINGGTLMVQTLPGQRIGIAGLPPSGYGERPTVIVDARDVAKLYAVLAELHGLLSHT